MRTGRDAFEDDGRRTFERDGAWLIVSYGSVWDADASARAYLVEFAPCASLALKLSRRSAKIRPEGGSMMQGSVGIPRESQAIDPLGWLL